MVTKEKAKEYARIYRERHRKEVNARVVKWAKNNPEKVKEYQKKWYEKNKDRVLEQHRAKADELREYQREWVKNNPDKVREYQRRAREKKKNGA